MPRTSLIGMGYYGTITPPVILRNVLENPAWYTAYTPYQPEISQGRLEALLNFQTMVAELTGFDLANASLLDEATAAAEAMTMARRLSKSDSNRFVVHHDTHPQTIAVLAPGPSRSASSWSSATSTRSPAAASARCSACRPRVARSPIGRAAIDAVHEVGGLAVVATDLLACVLTVPPAQLGADIAIGSAQRFGVPMGFGGPHAAFIAAEESAARALPGRLVGVSTDTEGRPALRLALQTREQHIRREKATSNICTAQVLLANIAGFYAAWHGPEGLRRIAERVHRLTSMAADASAAAGSTLVNDTWFDTVQVRCDAHAVLAAPPPPASTCASSTSTRSASASTRRRRRRRCRRCSPRSRSLPSCDDTDDRRAAPAGAPTSSSPRRCSPATTPSTRCSATCAAWPTRTWPSTAR